MHAFTPRQAAENDRFLAALRRTGNSSLAAREAGLNRSTLRGRRARSAVFAAQWEAAHLAAHAALRLAGGERTPEAPPRTGEGDRPKGGGEAARSAVDVLRTKGGEIIVGRTRGGRLQLRRAAPGRMTAEGEQYFLRALAASANVRLSAATAGFTHSAFYQKKKKRPAFAREMRISLSIGYDRLECAALAAGLPGAHGRGDWRRNDLPPLAPISWDQAFQLLCLHEKSVHQGWEQPHRRRRRGESDEIYSLRLSAMWTAEKNREAEDAALRRAEHYEETGSWRYPDEAPPPRLPPLDQVTGWSKADPAKKPHHPERAMFGGWRIEDWKRSRR
jgi:hypothetical protein